MGGSADKRARVSGPGNGQGVPSEEIGRDGLSAAALFAQPTGYTYDDLILHPGYFRLRQEIEEWRTRNTSPSPA